MQCPKDKSPLSPTVYEADVTVERCPTCGGTWLDAGELERIEQTVGRDYREAIANMPSDTIAAIEMAYQKSAPERVCPKCGRAMERREHGYCSQIMIDICPSCRGVWLDRGELAALEVFFEKSREETRELRNGFWASLRTLFHV